MVADWFSCINLSPDKFGVASAQQLGVDSSAATTDSFPGDTVKDVTDTSGGDSRSVLPPIEVDIEGFDGIIRLCVCGVIIFLADVMEDPPMESVVS